MKSWPRLRQVEGGWELFGDRLAECGQQQEDMTWRWKETPGENDGHRKVQWSVYMLTVMLHLVNQDVTWNQLIEYDSVFQPILFCLFVVETYRCSADFLQQEQFSLVICLFLSQININILYDMYYIYNLL